MLDAVFPIALAALKGGNFPRLFGSLSISSAARRVSRLLMLSRFFIRPWRRRFIKVAIYRQKKSIFIIIIEVQKSP
jgi:hypothetical protein